MKLSLISICIISGVLKLTEAEESPSSESIKLGAFSHEKTVEFFFNKKINQSLDVLSSLYGQNYNGSDATWLVPFTLFYYTTIAQRDDETALILTLADLYCDDVPASKRSNNAAAISGTDFRSIYGFGSKSWTRITSKDYVEASASRSWPQLDYNNYFTIEGLIKASAFSFKDPKEWVVRKIRSGLWSIVYAFALNSVISNDEFREMIETVTKRGRLLDVDSSYMNIVDLAKNNLLATISSDRRLDVDLSYKNIVDLATANLLPMISSERLQSIIEHSLPYPVSRTLIQRISYDRWSNRDEIRILILALKEFPDFPWASLHSTDQLRNHLETLCAVAYHLEPRSRAITAHFYHYDVAKELFIRSKGQTRGKFEDWLEDIIAGYMNGTLREDPIFSEDLLDCIVL